MVTIVIDGPEKAGKSTLLMALAKEWCARMGRGSVAKKRPWGPVPDDLVYLDALISDQAARDNELVIWDRSWASESVYALLLGRPRRLAADPWLGEWLYGRAVQTCGIRVMLSSDPMERAKRRDETDLPVDPYVEGVVFDDYAKQFGWEIYVNDYDPRTPERFAKELIELALDVHIKAGVRPPIYCGPPDSPIMVVGERRNEQSEFQGAWLPLTTRLTMNIGRSLGNDAFKLGWTNAHDVPPKYVREAQAIVALGEQAATWAQFTVGHKRVLELPHPAWMYRYGKGRDAIPRAEASLRELVVELIGVSK